MRVYCAQARHALVISKGVDPGDGAAGHGPCVISGFTRERVEPECPGERWAEELSANRIVKRHRETMSS
jgi:hypothetical protein